MKRLRKIMAVITIATITFGSLVSAISVAPTQAAAEEEVGVTPVATESTMPEAKVDTSGSEVYEAGGVVCEAPGISNVTVNDGLGADIDYFNDSTQISFNWNGFTAGNCPIVKYKYALWEMDSLNHSTVKITSGIVDDSITSMTILEKDFLTPLVEGKKYRVKILAKVRIKDSDGVWSDPVWSDKEGQTLDTIAPTMNYLALQQNKPYGGVINLTWVPATELNGIANYQIYRNGLLYDTVSGATNTYADVISGDNVEFTYYIKAADVAGNISESSNLQSATVDDIAPSAPSISYWIGGKNIVIFFPAVPNASTYEIYRSGVLIYSGPEIKYTDTNTVRGETYNYTAYALDEAGNRSLVSNTLEIYIPRPKVSSVATTGEVQGTSTGTTETTEKTEEVSPSPAPSGEVEAAESSAPEETQEESKTNWSLIIAIIIAAAIVVAGVLYWWYAREDEDEDEI